MTPLVIRVENTEASSSSQSAYIKSPIRIGRGELNDLQLDYPFVSTWHAVLRFEEDEVTFVDLGSTNGSFLGDRRLEKNVPVVLGAGDELRIGSLKLHVTRRQLAQAEARRSSSNTQFALRVADIPSISAPAARPVAAPAPAAPPPPPAAAPAAVRAVPAAPAPVLHEPAWPEPVPRSASPAAPAPPAGPSAAAAAALENASWQLGVLHEALAEASRNMDTAVEQALVGLTPADRQEALALVAGRFPRAARSVPSAPSSAPAEAQPYRAAPAPTAPEPAPISHGADSGLAEVALRLLRTFGEAYLPSSVSLDSREAVQTFLGAAAELFETAARSFVELRSGYDEFGREMGIRVARGEGPVASARDSRELLAYLLAPSQGTARAAELGSAFADLMMHQLALLAGVTGGARDVLARLSPEEILAELESEGGLSLKVKTLREGAQWRAFLDRYRELEEEGTLTATLFGKSFLRAYAAVAGRALQQKGGTGAGKGRPDDDDEDDQPLVRTPRSITTKRRS